MENAKHDYFIDNIKFILIFLVVFGHLIERYIDTNSTLMGVYMFIYIFHMPLFIFVSGLLSKNIKKSKTVFLKTLLIPYIVLNIVWYTLAYFYTGETNFPLLYPGWTLWFLLSLFFWRISLKYLVKIKYILPISFLLGLIVGLVSNGSILSFSRTIVFLPFFLLGYYTDIEKLKNISDKVNIWIAILGVTLFVALALFIADNKMIDYKFLYGSYSYSELSINIWQGILYRSLLYISSIALSIFVCSITPNSKTFYTDIGKSTMYIYAFHIYIVLIIFYLIPRWDMHIITNWIILISPLFVTYILSLKIFKRAYNLFFNSISKLMK
ncbi:acyltransferase family protein [Romboutsia sedimentorum]|uniref:Acyltransferase family protein n=1 Tax=Romboutsia sedimentorum TaxID=1368474 RepID=A0ABT7E4Y3_9FIRM|nr:acyltransferase family protein [Romboutsia sedimentorum]MDK2561927.1 acyltransferase family protein [Romboutsia sedimentorum]MDK2586721.1 acyltransferase family protein [Romboutsia sedimentorum]